MRFYSIIYSNSKQVEATLGGQLARIGKLVAHKAPTILHHIVKVDSEIRKSPKNKIIIWILELHAEVAFAE